MSTNKTPSDSSVKKQGSIKKQAIPKNATGSPDHSKNLTLRATPLEPAQTIAHYANKSYGKKQPAKHMKTPHDDSEADFVLSDDKKLAQPHTFGAGSSSGSLDRSRAERIGNDAYKNLLQVRAASQIHNNIKMRSLENHKASQVQLQELMIRMSSNSA